MIKKNISNGDKTLGGVRKIIWRSN